MKVVISYQGEREVASGWAALEIPSYYASNMKFCWPFEGYYQCHVAFETFLLFLKDKTLQKYITQTEEGNYSWEKVG